MKRLLFCGFGRSGKDAACEYVAARCGLRNAGTCSKYLVRHVAARLGLPEDVAYARRHDSEATRRFWRQVGDEVRAHDPAVIVREMMAHGDVGGGVRGRAELEAARAEGLFDLAVWVGRPGTPVDHTVEFAEEDCDVTVVNAGTLAEYHEKLDQLLRFAGML